MINKSIKQLKKLICTFLVFLGPLGIKLNYATSVESSYSINGEFLYKDLDVLRNSLLNDTEKTVRKIEGAIQRGQKICEKNAFYSTPLIINLFLYAPIALERENINLLYHYKLPNIYHEAYMSFMDSSDMEKAMADFASKANPLDFLYDVISVDWYNKIPKDRIEFVVEKLFTIFIRKHISYYIEDINDPFYCNTDTKRERTLGIITYFVSKKLLRLSYLVLNMKTKVKVWIVFLLPAEVVKI